MNSIEKILAQSNAFLVPSRGDDALGYATDRLQLSRLIASRYPEFERVRDGLLNRESLQNTDYNISLLQLADDCGLVERVEDGWEVVGGDARRYLTGGWLEEYIGLAAREAGADEVLIGQKIKWRVDEFIGENEIDVIARFDRRLFLCSCKALKSGLLPEDSGIRQKLTSALHEADNIGDHFGPPDAITGLAVTTDLFDEQRRMYRYQQLHGKAAVLRVKIFSLDDLRWEDIVRRISSFYF